MAKPKAWEKAKAKAERKARLKKAEAAQPSQIPPGQFDPGPGSIKSPRHNANTKNFATGKRGAARSR